MLLCFKFRSFQLVLLLTDGNERKKFSVLSIPAFEVSRAFLMPFIFIFACLLVLDFNKQQSYSTFWIV